MHLTYRVADLAGRTAHIDTGAIGLDDRHRRVGERQAGLCETKFREARRQGAIDLAASLQRLGQGLTRIVENREHAVLRREAGAQVLQADSSALEVAGDATAITDGASGTDLAVVKSVASAPQLEVELLTSPPDVAAGRIGLCLRERTFEAMHVASRAVHREASVLDIRLRVRQALAS